MTRTNPNTPTNATSNPVTDEADFLEDGAPTTDEEPDFIEMTPADEADIRGEARQ